MNMRRRALLTGRRTVEAMNADVEKIRAVLGVSEVKKTEEKAEKEENEAV